MSRTVSTMGGAADFKVGYKTGFASGASEKKFVPPLFQMYGYKQSTHINELMKKKKQESN